MNSPSALAFSMVQALQSAFKLIALLQLTAYMWPKQAVVNDGDSYDFIIVGAGTAGSVIANRLTENPSIQVLLIEAGGDPPTESDVSSNLLYLKRSRYDWNFTAVNNYVADQCHQKPYFEMSQGKMLGGTSSMNYFVYARGYPVDFNSWAELLKDKTWEWQNVVPYYRKSERLEDILNSSDKDYYGTNGYLGLTREKSGDISNYLDAFKEIGFETVLDYTPEHPLGYSNYLVMIADGHRQSTATAYLSPIKDRPNLHVLKETTVTKIIIKDNKATGVVAVTSDKKTLVINATKEVILSAGVFNSPKLLMLSGIGPKKHLISMGIDVLSDLPVGENLQDHAGVIFIHNLEKGTQKPIDPRLFPVSTFRGFGALDKNQRYPDYGVNNFIVDKNILLYFCSFAYRFKHEICDTIYRSNGDKMAVFNQILNLEPKSRGKILLKSSNPDDAPIIHTGQFTESEDLEKLIRFIQDLTPIINSTYYRRINAELVDPIPLKCKEFDAHSSEYWRCYAQCVSSSSMSHFTSTCAMGTVLNSRLKINGIQGLRMADASVMPNITHANPAATVIMISEKAADFIKEEYNLL